MIKGMVIFLVILAATAGLAFTNVGGAARPIFLVLFWAILVVFALWVIIGSLRRSGDDAGESAAAR